MSATPECVCTRRVPSGRFYGQTGDQACRGCDGLYPREASPSRLLTRKWHGYRMHRGRLQAMTRPFVPMARPAGAAVA